MSPSIPQGVEYDEVVAMMIQHTQTTVGASLPPSYTDDLARAIGVLQQLQLLMMSSWLNPTLADVAHLVLTVEHDFGSSAQLEQVIQALVGQHLAAQMAHRDRQLVRQEVAV
jgi:hypothetical protein